MKELYLIDASGFLYRAYFAIQGLSSRQGESTNALFGFIRSYIKLSDSFHPEYIAAIFDGPRSKAFRTNLYSEYKAHRKTTPEDLIQQIEETKTFCNFMSIPQITSDGVEADDTIASIATWAKNQGAKVFICTGDKDLAQLVDDHITIINPHKDNLIVDRKKVEDMFGVPPEQIGDYLAIIGDTSDNIPGITGLGPKSAVSLLQTYGSLEAIYEHLPEIGGKKQKTLEEEKDIAFLSKKLVALQYNVPFPKNEDFFRLGEQDIEELRTFYQQKNFSSLLKQLPQKKDPHKSTYHTVRTDSELEQLLLMLKQHPVICVDTETTDISPLAASIVGIGLGVDEKNAYYIPLNGALEKNTVLQKLKPLFESNSHAFFGHNIKYDFHVLENEGIIIKNIAFDTILASYVLHAEKRRHSLDQLTFDYFGITKIKTEELIGSGKHQKSMMDVPIEQVSEYCCEDIAYTIRLKDILEKELVERNLTHVLTEIELPLIKVLAAMERNGIFIDIEVLGTLSREAKTEIERLQEDIYRLAGEAFNINSPKQLSAILFDKLGITPPKKGKTMPSTGADVLEELACNYPIAEKLIEYRSYEKLRSTYIDALPEYINKKTHRVHCQFNQSVAATGRLSCQDPNLQNIPIKTALGKRIREAFCPQKTDYSFLSADYSQIELRLLAHITQDEGLLQAFNSGQDIHAYTASLVFNIPQEAVTEDMRRHAKAVNFGIVYGQQAFGLSQELHISVKDAERFIRSYFDRYPKVKDYIDSAKQTARETGKAVTLTGRERSIPEINATNQILRNAAERLAINTPLQGTAADLIKMAMLAIDKWLTKEQLQAKMLLQIHDELLFEVPNAEIEQLKTGVSHYMQTVLPLSVPLLVEIGVGKNWKEC